MQNVYTLLGTEKPIGIYCRVSTNLQNTDQQKEMIIDWCKRQGVQYRTYVDEAVSGKISVRPAWKKLLKDCNKGLVSGIVVTKWDRITRNLSYAIDFLKWIKEHDNLILYSLYDGSFDFSPDNIFMFKLKCLLSEYELDIIKWRSRIGIERAKAEGKYKGGKAGRKWKRSEEEDNA